MAAGKPTHASDRLGASFEGELTLRLVTGIMAAVVGLTFLFGFGNMWTLALRLGVPPWVARLVAPAVDLSVMGLLLGTRYLALRGASRERLRPARRLLVFSSVMTLALNVTDPLLAGQNGKAAFDAVGPLLLIGWAEVGPGLLQAINDAGAVKTSVSSTQGFWEQAVDHAGPETEENVAHPRDSLAVSPDEVDQRGLLEATGDDFLERARSEDAWHWETYQRPISAETLRKRLHVGAARSRMLVAMVRSSSAGRLAGETSPGRPAMDQRRRWAADEGGTATTGGGGGADAEHQHGAPIGGSVRDHLVRQCMPLHPPRRSPGAQPCRRRSHPHRGQCVRSRCARCPRAPLPSGLLDERDEHPAEVGVAGAAVGVAAGVIQRGRGHDLVASGALGLVPRTRAAGSAPHRFEGTGCAPLAVVQARV